MTKRRHAHKSLKWRFIRSVVLLAFSAGLIATGIGALWVATLKMPDLDSFNSRRVIQSTKIYDRTGTILLYDTGTNIKRTVVPLSEISPNVQKAAIAIEDSDFYTNIGISPSGILRAVFFNITSGGYGQGGSTITQQVVKNALLTQKKTLTRKIEEWVLAVKLTRIMTKDQILEAYLNETAYGGVIYGVEEASQAFFGRPAKDLSLGQAAYLAAIPQAPTYFSPYGQHKNELTARQKLVLSRMKELSVITDAEYQAAIKEDVVFLASNTTGIRAPHFVMMVKEYLTQKYGEDKVNEGGLRVTTSLNYDMQQKAEKVITNFGPSLQSNFNASNTAMVAIDPKSGDILTMVGSRDYFDTSIDGNFNVALAKRQPGSTFKPFVYATLFEKGYTPETILYDVKTEFSSECTPESKTKNPTDDPEKICYSPGEFDNIFEGPIPIRRALAQSRNVPAVEALYLAGIPDALKTAHDMGITSLNDPQRYGLTLVLGGGEVTLLDLTSAYGVFANDGVRNPYRSILKITDKAGTVLEEASMNSQQVMPEEVVRQISSILSDTSVRMNSLKPIGESVGRTVAIKTGTTNDFRDVWTLGYTPNLVVGAWAGKNDNTPMNHDIAALIITPVWGAFMSQVAKDFPEESFKTPPAPLTDNKPVLRGIWQGGISYWKDSFSGKVATQFTPLEARQEIVFNNVHNILHWVDKADPLGPSPADPTKDSQYENWEFAVRAWFTEWQKAHPEFKEDASVNIPTVTDDVHVPGKMPMISIASPVSGSAIDPRQVLNILIQQTGTYPPKKTEVYLNGKYVLTDTNDPLRVSFVPNDVGNLSDNNTLSVVFYDEVFNRAQATSTFSVIR